MKEIISEIQIVPVKPNNGLIGFCSFVIFNSIYCGSVAIYTRPKGNIRLVYPTKNLKNTPINIFHPINNKIGSFIESQVAKKLNNF